MCLSFCPRGCLPPPPPHTHIPPGKTPPGQTSPCPAHAWIHPHPPLPLPPTPTPSHPPSACWDTVNKRLVRIPLECILVYIYKDIYTLWEPYWCWVTECSVDEIKYHWSSYQNQSQETHPSWQLFLPDKYSCIYWSLQGILKRINQLLGNISALPYQLPSLRRIESQS